MAPRQDAITDSSAAIDLAREPDFRLGDLFVRPSACRVVTASREQRIEPRVMEVLVFFARSANRTVTRDDLIDACWGGRFVSDDAVNRVIVKVRTLARGLEPPPFSLETVPKVGFRFAGLSAAPPAATDIPKASAGPAATPARVSVPAAVWRRPRLLAAVALALVAVVSGLVWRLSQPAAAGQNGRVEVMLFEPLQQDAALKRYSVALGDAVARLLTSNGVDTFQRARAPDTGGRGQGAEFRVAGTIDRDGDRYVINAQILDRRSGGILWSGRFDRDARTPVGFQEEAANRIADGLDCALWRRAAGRRAMKPEVFSLFLNACVARRASSDETQAFMKVTGRLVQGAPDYSFAHSFHALALAVGASNPLAGPSEVESLSRAVEAASQQALRLDRRNGEAYLALGVRYRGWGHWLEREQSFLRAASLSPTLGVVRNFYAPLLREVGRWQEAEAMNRRTIADDPFSPTQLSTLVSMRAAAGDLAEAEALNKRIDLLDPKSARRLRYTIALFWEDPREGIANLSKYAPAAADRDLACHRAYLARLIEARGAPRRGMPQQCEGRGDYRVRMLARQGDVDGAYAALAAHPANYRFPNLFFYPEMKAFRRDPRFMPLVHRLGLVDYWTKSGQWPDFCAEPDLPYDCRAMAKALTGA